ncbi:DUF4864 domain-containing protein [Haloarcula nitratireducens]|uniref:DUF4864 domain-containing protein n=1 Tax=Haloarcula nitratireducens TaxID=2487749 RepID=A0AAW4PI11_9EURY|nr:DUF4864 domain-containing protein [Halomicroarcula nitratireducens]MBX0297268.1 DUF4864 domain-containing protein [Halomicroarcula nitratireducens]
MASAGWAPSAALVALVCLAGCGSLFGGGTDSTGAGVTPAPVPDIETLTPRAVAADGNGRALAGGMNAETNLTETTVTTARTVAQPRYLSLRPNCKRPPGLVVHIQINALRNNDPATDEGINTTWQFAAPSNRETVGSYANFVEIVTDQYRPLLRASTVTYETLEQRGGRASQRVVVSDGTETTAYVWYLELQTVQTTEPYGGCWMTTGVVAE